MSSPNEAGTLFRVDGMIAVVTGGGTGIGLQMARALAANGAAKVYILGRRMDKLQSAASANFPDILTPLECDVTSKPSLQAVVDTIAAAHGFVNLVVANSGVGGPLAGYDPTLSVSDLRKKLFDGVEPEEVTAAYHVNATGALFTMLAFLELLDAGNKRAAEGKGFGAAQEGVGGGKVPLVKSQVVITASISAFMRARWSAPAYVGSKAAVVQLAKQAAAMLAPYGIRVNALAPGLFPSELATHLISHRKPEEEGYDHPLFIPTGRFGGEEEMAGLILYLASRAGSYCNGSIMVADGGRLAVSTASY